MSDENKILNKRGLRTVIATMKKVFAPISHNHTKSQITDFPASMPASDVPAWAKANMKPTYTCSEIGAATQDHNHNDSYYIKSEVDQKISDNTTYHIWVVSSNGDVLLSSDSTTLTCQITKADNYVDTSGTNYSYSWRRYIHGKLDGSWCQHGKSVSVSADNFTESIIYVCEVMQFYNIQDPDGNQLTDASGNILIGYYPCMTADITLFRSFDEKLRNYATTSQLNALSTGTGASGTWGISISGNAATATTANSANSVAWSNVSDVPTFVKESDYETIIGDISFIRSFSHPTNGNIADAINNINRAYQYSDSRLEVRIQALEDIINNNTYYIE